MADNHPSSAIVAQRARDADGSRITPQLLVCPVTDCDLDIAPYVDAAGHPMLNREGMIRFWDQHAQHSTDRTRSDASALRGSLAGLPVAVALTTWDDPSRDDRGTMDYVVDGFGEQSRRPAGVTR